ncbi:Imm6 family immunity protein [Paenibacillus spongiae]|uniref:Immunity 6 family protein n=1 Tax=Paenibacillus spongiae TaxID=2909671 RepID=A0ABY5S3U4_9BACL|nr:Imm6 family immunity protein [Paenibacillus spongiae]UVI27393.1 immunity 6 family protein [Paenibacillus spongiae]
MDQFKYMSKDAKVAYFLGLTEIVIPQLSKSPHYAAARTALSRCWEWLEHKRIEAFDLYSDLENMEYTGIITLLQSEVDDDKLTVWFCIADAMIIAIYGAYGHQNNPYLPQTIESGDSEETFEEFHASYLACAGQDAENTQTHLLSYLTDHFPIWSTETPTRTEIMRCLVE